VLKDNAVILGIDSSTSVLKIGLSLSDGRVVSHENVGRYSHAEFIFGLIEKILSKNGINKSEIDLIAVSLGPGSFTGLRVGLATAKGLALALNVGIQGITTFASVSTELFRKFGSTAVLIPSRRNEYYLSVIDTENIWHPNVKVVTSEEIPEAIGTLKVLGIDFDPTILPIDTKRIISETGFTPKIKYLIDCARIKESKFGVDNLSDLEPWYIQNFPSKPGTGK
jgi:tRNA threonylcarbamoyl adenosine modification protein YeaZ